jgi:preprotein translocase subunit SecG
MQTILTIVQVFLSIALIALVLIQHGRGADAGAAFGSGASATVFGSRGSSSFLSRATGILAALFFLTSMALAYYAAQGGKPAGLMDAADGMQVKVPAVEPSIPVPPVAPSQGSGEVPVVPGVTSRSSASDVPMVPGARPAPAESKSSVEPVPVPASASAPKQVASDVPAVESPKEVVTKPETPKQEQVPATEALPQKQEAAQVESKPVVAPVEPVASDVPAVEPPKEVVAKPETPKQEQAPATDALPQKQEAAPVESKPVVAPVEPVATPKPVVSDVPTVAPPKEEVAKPEAPKQEPEKPSAVEALPKSSGASDVPKLELPPAESTK